MALIKCEKCNNEISDKARRCPICSCMPKKNKRKIILSIIAIFLLLFISVILVNYGMHLKKKKREEELYNKYIKGESFCEQEEYEKASKIFRELPSNYNDVNKYLVYLEAITSFENGEFDIAKEKFDSLEKFVNSSQYKEKCIFMMNIQGEWILHDCYDTIGGCAKIDGWEATFYYYLFGEYHSLGKSNLLQVENEKSVYKSGESNFELYYNWAVPGFNYAPGLEVYVVSGEAYSSKTWNYITRDSGEKCWIFEKDNIE